MGRQPSRLTNRPLSISARRKAATLLKLACGVSLLAALVIVLLGEHWLIAVAMAFMLGAFAMAIPLIFGSALVDYADCRGTAGALFGLLYYLLIGGGVALAGWSRALDGTLLGYAICALAASAGYRSRRWKLV